MKLLPRIETPKGLRPGMTTVELSVAITVLLLLVGMLFVGAKAYKRGTDRSGCVLNIYTTQNAVRSYANLNGLSAGQKVARVNLKKALHGPRGFLDKAPACPADGKYTTLGNTIPAWGELYLACSLASTKDHLPDSYQSW